MTEYSPEQPPAYRKVGQYGMLIPDAPYPQLVWLWVYYNDRGKRWSTTGSGVLIDDDVILTCAHIFASKGATIDQVVNVSAFTGYNQLLQSEREPDGGRDVEAVFVCGKAFPDVRRQDKADSAWDLAVVCLRNTVPAREGPAFVVSPEQYLADNFALKGPNSKLMTAGYGGPDGVIVEATMSIVEAYEELHWMGVDPKPSPGLSGAPIFYLDTSPSQNPEYRLVGVVSAEDRTARNRTLGAMITDRTAEWIASAQKTWRKVKAAKVPGGRRQQDEFTVRLHYPD